MANQLEEYNEDSSERYKVCSKCEKKKSRSDFYKAERYKDGLQSYCKDCNKQKAREWHQTHQEERNQHQKQYDMQHKISQSRKDANKRGLGFNIICPPDDFLADDWFSFKLVFHHINDNDVVLIPEPLHKQYNGLTTEQHRAKLLPIIKQHYSNL